MSDRTFGSIGVVSKKKSLLKKTQNSWRQKQFLKPHHGKNTQHITLIFPEKACFAKLFHYSEALFL